MPRQEKFTLLPQINSTRLFRPATFLLLTFPEVQNDQIVCAADISEATKGQSERLQKENEIDENGIKTHAHQLLEDLSKKIKDDSEDGQNYFKRAFIYYRLKDYKKAFSDCQQAEKL